VDKRPPDWELEGFNEAFRWWVDLDSPPRAVQRGVTHWITRLYEDPYLFARRVPNFGDPNFWEARIPGSRDGQGHIILCSYWIWETTRTVRGSLFGTFEEETLE
jgi:hypothetical protein